MYEFLDNGLQIEKLTHSPFIDLINQPDPSLIQSSNLYQTYQVLSRLSRFIR